MKWEWVYSAVTLAFAVVFLVEYIKASREGENLIVKMLQDMCKAARVVGEHIVGREKRLRGCAMGVGFCTLILCAPALAAVTSMLQPFDISEWPWRLGFVACSALLLPTCIPAFVRFNRWLLGER